MITTQNLSVAFSNQSLFEEVNVKFTPGNCYGLIGANGAGKSTFLKCLAGKIEPTSGTVSVEPNKRLSMLSQDHSAFNEVPVLTTVIMGHKRLHALMAEKDALYAKPDFSDEDGVRAGLDWDSVVRIDGMVKLLLEQYRIHYLPIDTPSMQERVRAVEFVLGRLGLEQQNVAEHLMPQKVVTLLKRG